MPTPEVNATSAPPPSCLRITAEAARKTVNVPLRCVWMTASHSSSDMLNNMRSRRMPATHTTPSMRPNLSTAADTMRSPASIVEMSSAMASALPPAASISRTTPSATSLDGSLPSMLTPKSFTTTAAPSAAQASATARPMPRPAPVTAITLSLRKSVITCTSPWPLPRAERYLTPRQIRSSDHSAQGAAAEVVEETADRDVREIRPRADAAHVGAQRLLLVGRGEEAEAGRVRPAGRGDQLVHVL